MERDRGISITSAALQFAYRDTVDQPARHPGPRRLLRGHLPRAVRGRRRRDAGRRREGPRAADAEAVRGLPAPRHPDHHGHQQVGPARPRRRSSCMDEISTRDRPAAHAADLAGRDRRRLPRRAGPAHRRVRRGSPAPPAAPPCAAEEHLDAGGRRRVEGDACVQAAVEEQRAARRRPAPTTTRSASWPGRTTPVLFGSAVLNFGVRQLLDTLRRPRPAAARRDRTSTAQPRGRRRAVQRVRVQGAGRHGRRPPRPARVRAGRAPGSSSAAWSSRTPATGRPFATKYAQAGLRPRAHDASSTRLPRRHHRPGQRQRAAASATRLYVDEPVEFPPIPTLRPRALRRGRAAKDIGRYKQFRRGIEQLDQEGVVQVLRSDLRGDQAPGARRGRADAVRGREHRMEQRVQRPGDPRAPRLLAGPAHRPTPSAPALNAPASVEVLSRTDGELLAIFSDRWRLQSVERELPDAVLEALVVSV